MDWVTDVMAGKPPPAKDNRENATQIQDQEFFYIAGISSPKGLKM